MRQTLNNETKIHRARLGHSESAVLEEYLTFKATTQIIL